MRFHFIAKEKANFSICRMCKVLRVSESGTTLGCLALPVSANATTGSIWPIFVPNMPVIIGPMVASE